MAVGIGTPVTGGLNNGATSTTQSFTSTSQPLYVLIDYWASAGLMSGVTYGGTALTKVADSGLSSGQDNVQIWRLTAPTAGTANVVITAGGIGEPGGFVIFNTTGQDTGTPEGASKVQVAGGAAGTSTGSQTLSGAATGDLVLGSVAVGAAAAVTPAATGGGSITELVDTASNNEEYEVFTVPDAVTAVSATFASNTWAFAAVILKAGAGGGVSGPGLSSRSLPRITGRRPGFPPAPIVGLRAATFYKPQELVIPGVSGPAFFPIELDVTSVTVSAIQNQIGKLLSVTSTTSPALLKSIAKTLAVTTTTTAAVATQKLKLVLLTVTSTTTAAITKQIGKLVAVTTTTSPRLTKLVGKILAVTSTTVPALTAIKAKFVTLLATTTTVPAIQRQVGKVLAVTSTTSSRLTKLVGKGLSVTTTTSAALAAVKAKFVILAVTTTTSPVIRRQIGKLVAVTSSTQSTIVKRITKTVAVVTTTVPSVVKRIGKTLATSSVTQGAITVLKNVIVVNPLRPPVLAILSLPGRAGVMLAGARDRVLGVGGRSKSLGGGADTVIGEEGKNEVQDGDL